MTRITLIVMLAASVADASGVAPVIGLFQEFEFVIPERVHLPEVPTQAEIDELNAALAPRVRAILLAPRDFTVAQMYDVQIEATHIHAMQEQRNYYDRRMAQIEATGVQITAEDARAMMSELHRIFRVFEARASNLREAQVRDEQARADSIKRMVQNIGR